MTRSRAWVLAGLLLCGCAGYHAQPLAPAASAAAFGSRTLSDTALASFLQTYDSTKSAVWDVQRLALTAWYFRPDLEVARRAWHTAQAAEVTAGARPPVAVSGALEHANSSGPFESPWTVTLAAVFRIELGGKRGARIAAAEARALVAELQAKTLAWDIASDVRSATLTVVQRDSSVTTWQNRVERSDMVVAQAEKLYQADAVQRSAVEQVTSESRLATRELAGAQAQSISARAALANLLGVPAAAVDTLQVSTSGSIGCDWTSRESLESLRAIALRRRYEMGQALAEYAVAEADLRVEISKQYPDLDLAPGYSWDQGLQRWIAALALPNLLLNRNQGPIGEAVARRNQMASNVEAVQQQVLGQVEASVAQCRAVGQQVTAAGKLVEALQNRERSARAAFERGETTQLEGMGLALSVASSVASLQDARLQDAVVGSDLERVTGLWTTEGAPGLPDPLLLPSATFVVQEAER